MVPETEASGEMLLGHNQNQPRCGACKFAVRLGAPQAQCGYGDATGQPGAGIIAPYVRAAWIMYGIFSDLLVLVPYPTGSDKGYEYGSTVCQELPYG
eukprot:scaffold15114_cov41-Prasinocladus_malaysianus.AAC.1